MVTIMYTDGLPIRMIMSNERTLLVWYTFYSLVDLVNFCTSQIDCPKCLVLSVLVGTVCEVSKLNFM